MPDIVGRRTHQGNLVDRKIVKNKNLDGVLLSPLHCDLDSYQPPYRHTVTTTAYGVNEPQWSEGPPPLNFEGSPYSPIPLPALSATPITIHPLLAFHPVTPIAWQIRDTPNNAVLAYHIRRQKFFHWQSLLAFEPTSVTSITIILEPFDRPFVVFASDTTRGITIGDILMAVYKAARAGATRIFCEHLNIDTELLAPAMQEYGEMVNQDTGPMTGDDTVSFSVSQYMNFRTNWAGLTPSTKERDVWILHTKTSGF
ncbi:hypothetical protein BYT27DRAFT_7181278 [Phlegmacium glaucopus]|nr:hypothetical protein BYT27DRAFT_7181278 [Phlegmacium glaucopus]